MDGTSLCLLATESGTTDQAGPDQSSAADESNTGGVVRISAVLSGPDASDAKMYHIMLEMVVVLRRVWPDFIHWKNVRFEPRPFAVMLRQFFRWIEGQFELYGSLDDYMANETNHQDLIEQLAVGTNPALLIGEGTQWFDDLSPCRYGLNDDLDSYEASLGAEHQPLWLYFVFAHVFRVRNYYDMSLSVFAVPPKNDNPYDDLGIRTAFRQIPKEHPNIWEWIVPILFARKETKPLATCLAYAFKITGNQFADSAIGEGDEVRISWGSLDSVLKLSAAQREGNAIATMYYECNWQLAGDIEATKEFIKPLYAAYRTAQRRINEAPKTLMDILGRNDAAAPTRIRVEAL